MALFVPPGVAHGFQTLEDDCEVLYQMTDVYRAELADGVRWNDPAFGIAWPLPCSSIHERDAGYGDFDRERFARAVEETRGLERHRMSAPFAAIATLADAAPLARRAMELIADIYPLRRSITGEGVRETLRRVARRVPLEVTEVPSGTPAFDWEVPPEWTLRDAYVADASGRRLIDVRRHALHVLGYSTPVRQRMSLDELRPHLHTLPQRPDWIPYRTSYYREAWGFCLAQSELASWPEGRVRGRDRLGTEAGQPDLCRVPGSRCERARNPRLHAHLPSGPGKRQRQRHCRCGRPRRGSPQIAAESVVSVHLRPRHNRIDRLALRATRRGCRTFAVGW